MNSKAAVALAVAFLLVLSLRAGTIVNAATPATGTITTLTPTVTWTGSAPVANPTIGLTTSFNPNRCLTVGYCDLYTLNFNIPSDFATAYPNYFLNISITWASTQYDYDLYVYYNGVQVGSDLLGSGTNYEIVTLAGAQPGTYQIYADNWLVPPGVVYSGVATLGLTPPPYSFPTRSATYVDDTAGKSAGTPFVLTPDLRLVGAQQGACTVICPQDVEPGIKIDPFGTIYAAAIQGTPGGTDFWRSSDGGNSFQYLGQPDGAQNALLNNQTIGGLGGGDEDIALGSPFVLLDAGNGLVVNSTGRVYLSSLFWDGLGVNPFPESITVADSVNRGSNWLVSSTDLPLDDRQWTAASGASNYYITYNDIGVELTGSSNLVMLQSTDGGLTFTNGAFIGKTLGTDTSIFQGPVATGPDGSLYNVYAGPSPRQINLATCPAPCSLPPLPLSAASASAFTVTPAFRGPTNMTVTSVFPQVAVDASGNIYVAWSTGRSIYLISSSDGGKTWTLPVRVNNGPETATALEPWLQAGDNGRVALMWYGTSVSSNSPDNFTAFANAQWKTFYAVTPNALSSQPTFYQVVASGGKDLPDGVVHRGPICTEGTACPSGSRNLAEYSSFTIDNYGFANFVIAQDANTTSGFAAIDYVKQTAGPGLFAPSLGRAIGSGAIALPGGQGSFHFRVDSTPKGLKGSLQYLDSDSSLLVQGGTITSFFISGNTASFTGTGTVSNGKTTTSVTFTIQVVGNKGPATSDTFSISLSNGYKASGSLASGSIRVLSSSQT
ncbi:MAG: hypothetical protein HY247_05275 [archaeon]|nr:MAG: hypothetical protein HY247_05275 [archaeon]